MRTDRALDAQDAQELPELVFREMSAEEVQELRAKQIEQNLQPIAAAGAQLTDIEERPFRPGERIVTRR
jgi:hypothetical protein